MLQKYRQRKWHQDFLAYFPYFEEIEEAYEITLLSVCLSVYEITLLSVFDPPQIYLFFMRSVGVSPPPPRNFLSSLQSMSYLRKVGISSSQNFLYCYAY
jgi:hypothetical protein